MRSPAPHTAQHRPMISPARGPSGRRAVWTVLMGVKKGDLVYIYKGVVEGHIVKPRGDSNFGFGVCFGRPADMIFSRVCAEGLRA